MTDTPRTLDPRPCTCAASAIWIAALGEDPGQLADSPPTR